MKLDGVTVTFQAQKTSDCKPITSVSECLFSSQIHISKLTGGRYDIALNADTTLTVFRTCVTVEDSQGPTRCDYDKTFCKVGLVVFKA